jgi:hypothetical protein
MAQFEVVVTYCVLDKALQAVKVIPDFGRLFAADKAPSPQPAASRSKLKLKFFLTTRFAITNGVPE